LCPAPAPDRRPLSPSRVRDCTQGTRLPTPGRDALYDIAAQADKGLRLYHVLVFVRLLSDALSLTEGFTFKLVEFDNSADELYKAFDAALSDRVELLKEAPADKSSYHLAVLGKTNGNVIKEASAAALKRLGVLAVLECADQLTGYTARN
jgi:hypothetical protein